MDRARYIREQLGYLEDIIHLGDEQEANSANETYCELQAELHRIYLLRELESGQPFVSLF